MTAISAIVQERCLVRFDAGDLECELSYPQDGHPTFGLLIAGPHPYMGGNLDNNVVRAWSVKTARQGGLALTFNYTGVGRSSGPAIDVARAMEQFWQTGHAPQDDFLTANVLNAWYYLTSLANIPLLVGGYSFGCWCMTKNLSAIQPSGVIFISPTLGRHDFELLNVNEAPVCVVVGEKDFVNSGIDLAQWIQRYRCIRSLHRFENGEHFFRGQEDQVAGLALAFVRQLLK